MSDPLSATRKEVFFFLGIANMTAQDSQLAVAKSHFGTQSGATQRNRN